MRRIRHAVAAASTFVVAGTVAAACSSSHDGGSGLDAGAARDGAMVVSDGSVSGGAEWRACTVTSECTLAWRWCWCAPGPSIADVDAVRNDPAALEAHRNEVCPPPDVGCDRPVGTSAGLVATCESSECTAIDVHWTSYTACETDADCVLRYTGCCGCTGEPRDVIAVRRDAVITVGNLFCDPGGCTEDCTPPEPTPAYTSAFCADDHHCAVRILHPA